MNVTGAIEAAARVGTADLPGFAQARVSLADTAYLLRYYHAGSEVEGWLDAHAVDTVIALLLLQSGRGLTGSVLEIGVHHGRHFILLALCIQAGETAVALDVFEQQHLNIDRSGHGSREQLLHNIGRFCPHKSGSIELVQASSLAISASELTERFGRFRAVSIDGSHTPEATLSDLRLAEASLVDGGVVFLDDLLNAHWLGVISGYAAYAAAGGGLVPFCYCGNKLFLCKGGDFAEDYARRLEQLFPTHVEKRHVPFFGREISCLAPAGALFGSLRDLAADLDEVSSLRRALDHARREVAERERQQSALLEEMERQELELAASAIAMLRTECLSEGARLSELEGEIKRLEDLVRSMKRSVSWQITAPLREVRRAARNAVRLLGR